MTTKKETATMPKTAHEFVSDLKTLLGEETNVKIQWDDELRYFTYKVLVKPELKNDTIKALLDMGTVSMKRSADGIRITIVVKR